MNNYAFLDGTNIHMTMSELGWKLDMKKFRVYLNDKYHISKAYYFIGYLPSNNDLYTNLQTWDFILVFKQTLHLPGGKIKGNCDAQEYQTSQVCCHDTPRYRRYLDP